MKKERIKVYIYTRVSTTMQIDGYSLDAQKSRMKAFADYNDYEFPYCQQLQRLSVKTSVFRPWK